MKGVGLRVWGPTALPERMCVGSKQFGLGLNYFAEMWFRGGLVFEDHRLCVSLNGFQVSGLGADRAADEDVRRVEAVLVQCHHLRSECGVSGLGWGFSLSN